MNFLTDLLGRPEHERAFLILVVGLGLLFFLYARGVESELGRGTTFRVLLPRSTAPVSRPAEADAGSDISAVRTTAVLDGEAVEEAPLDHVQAHERPPAAQERRQDRHPPTALLDLVGRDLGAVFGPLRFSACCNR